MNSITEIVHEPTILVVFIFIIITLIIDVNRINRIETSLSKLLKDYEDLKKLVYKRIETSNDTKMKIDIIDKYMQQDDRYEIIRNNSEKLRDKALVAKKVASMLDPRNKEEDND